MVSYQLFTTFPASSGYNQIEAGISSFQLPLQQGDVGHDYTLTHAESYTLPSGTTITFSNQALSFYPDGSQIGSDVTTATATVP